MEIAGVNWFGLESDVYAPHGLWTRNYQDMMDQMAALGFNTIRLPYSSEMLHTTAAPSGIDYSLNPDLQGLAPIEVMDAVIDYAGQIGMKVILDHHRSTAGAGVSDNGLWYDGYLHRAGLDRRLEDVGAALRRRPDGDRRRPAQRALQRHLGRRREPPTGPLRPNGPATLCWRSTPTGWSSSKGSPSTSNQYYWYGGNLMGVADRPIELDVPDKLVYSAHDYPNSVYAQPWFQDPNFGDALPDKFESMWGYIYEQNIAPVYLGEFGTMLTDPKDVVWYEAITSYLSGDFDNNGTIDIPQGTEGISWTYWSWNPNSGDTGGILADDWNTVNDNKLVYLEPLEFTFDDTSGATLARFVITLAEPSTEPVTVDYATSDGTATAGSDYLGASGSVTFEPGETSKTVAVVVTGDTVAEGDETFTVALSNPSGATIDDGSATGTIVDSSAA